MARAFQTWTIRNPEGQLIGRWRATSAQAAINQCLDADAVQGSSFKAYTGLDPEELTAEVEG